VQNRCGNEQTAIRAKLIVPAWSCSGIHYPMLILFSESTRRLNHTESIQPLREQVCLTVAALNPNHKELK
jgi:hypothetical protein